MPMIGKLLQRLLVPCSHGRKGPPSKAGTPPTTIVIETKGISLNETLPSPALSTITISSQAQQPPTTPRQELPTTPPKEQTSQVLTNTPGLFAPTVLVSTPLLQASADPLPSPPLYEPTVSTPVLVQESSSPPVPSPFLLSKRTPQLESSVLLTNTPLEEKSSGDSPLLKENKSPRKADKSFDVDASPQKEKSVPSRVRASTPPQGKLATELFILPPQDPPATLLPPTSTPPRDPPPQAASPPKEVAGMRPKKLLFVSDPAALNDVEEKAPTIVTPTGNVCPNEPQELTPSTAPFLETSAPPSSTEKWDQATSVLQDHPSLINTQLLNSILTQRPPLNVIQFLLVRNPKAATTIPKEGPTPLQVAVESNVSIDVVEILLRACPFALVATNPPHLEDPLSFAKRRRKKDKALLKLLGKPLGYWVSEQPLKVRSPNASVTQHASEHWSCSSYPTQEAAKSTSRREATPKSSRNVKKNSEVNHAPVDRQELDNVKLLCAQMLKGHKRLAKRVATLKKQLDESTVKNALDKEAILKEFNDEQQHHFFRQLIAMDMKERAFLAKVVAVEESCVKRCECKMEKWKQGLDCWQSTTQAKMNEFEVLLQHEVEINSHFRQDLTGWIEEQQSGNTSPFVFSTDMGEEDETLPLYPTKEVENEERMDRHPLDELNRVKKRPWKPLFKHWDRIRLVDDQDE